MDLVAYFKRGKEAEKLNWTQGIQARVNEECICTKICLPGLPPSAHISINDTIESKAFVLDLINYSPLAKNITLDARIGNERALFFLQGLSAPLNLSLFASLYNFGQTPSGRVKINLSTPLRAFYLNSSSRERALEAFALPVPQCIELALITGKINTLNYRASCPVDILALRAENLSANVHSLLAVFHDIPESISFYLESTQPLPVFQLTPSNSTMDLYMRMKGGAALGGEGDLLLQILNISSIGCRRTGDGYEIRSNEKCSLTALFEDIEMGRTRVGGVLLISNFTKVNVAIHTQGVPFVHLWGGKGSVCAALHASLGREKHWLDLHPCFSEVRAHTFGRVFTPYISKMHTKSIVLSLSGEDIYLLPRPLPTVLLTFWFVAMLFVVILYLRIEYAIYIKWLRRCTSA